MLLAGVLSDCMNVIVYYGYIYMLYKFGLSGFRLFWMNRDGCDMWCRKFAPDFTPLKDCFVSDLICITVSIVTYTCYDRSSWISRPLSSCISPLQ